MTNVALFTLIWKDTKTGIIPIIMSMIITIIAFSLLYSKIKRNEVSPILYTIVFGIFFFLSMAADYRGLLKS